MNRNVKIIYGAPCSGKTTYAKRHMGKKDVVCDGDAITNALRLSEGHDQPAYLFELLMSMRNSFANFLGTSKGAGINTFWIIARRRDSPICKIAERHSKPEYIEMKATQDECLTRLMSDSTRQDKEFWRGVILKYFSETEGLKNGTRKI